MKCYYCESTNTKEKELVKKTKHKGIDQQKWICLNCGKIFRSLSKNENQTLK